ncbi:MAG: carboxymuconolactone decarboxylase family protein [Desulfovibrio sp.]|jgi:alkylhydroperoxidase/carboxymuconolactone decarboxylase family protein YurZ|nr:carboxymuconolactone decarboxylase family protein [Desulfovibrio sp.]
MLRKLLTLLLCIALMSIVEARAMETLTDRQKSMAAIAAFTARGDMQRLDGALNQGLDAGLTINEIKEILVQLYAYTGFPRSLNAIGAFMKVLDARKAKGVVDPVGKEPSPMPKDRSSLEFGTENQTKLAGRSVKGPLYDFAPAIDQFLKAHLFGDIFQRDNIDWQSREIATIAALASIEGVDAQLQAHFNIGMNTGLTPDQLKGIVAMVKERVGTALGANAESVLQKTLASRKQ